MNECKINLPKSVKNYVNFKNYSKKEKVQFVVYADCECLLKPVEEETICNTDVLQRHSVLQLLCKMQLRYSSSGYHSCPEGAYLAKWFAHVVHQLTESVNSILKNIITMGRQTTEEIEAFANSTICHICEGLILPNQKKVRNHLHVTGKYQGPRHEKCNLNYHDSHFIIEDIFLEYEGKIDFLSLNKKIYFFY